MQLLSLDLEHIITQGMMSLSIKQKLINDTLDQSYEIALGGGAFGHCLVLYMYSFFSCPFVFLFQWIFILIICTSIFEEHGIMKLTFMICPAFVKPCSVLSCLRFTCSCIWNDNHKHVVWFLSFLVISHVCYFLL